MKKALFFAAVAAAMTACTSDVDLGMQQANQENADNAIGFQVLNKNMSRATLDEEGHYNFGVWAYKENDGTNNIMANYLVGFFGTNVGYQKFDGTTTEGMTSSDKGVSKWGYEGLGTAQYGLAGHTFTHGYYNPTDDSDYMSNHEYQYLRYWDYSSTHTNFYAYAPYIKSATAPVTYNNGDHTMTFPMGSIQDGVNDVTKYEYMYAAAKVLNANYNKAVQLSFKRLNAKVNIAFYEDIAGYDVILEKLVDGTVDISAAPATQSGSTHIYSNGLRKTAGAKVEFTGSDYTTATVTNDYTGSSFYRSGEYLKFDLPATKAAIATSRAYALNDNKATSYSTTTYYAIPKDDANECGLTFHVSFTLKSTTNETIKVQDARVYVPATYCKWKANKKYTYVFKITKDVTGTTGSTTPAPGAPEIGAKALYPIVFDGITVVDWEDGFDDSGNDHDLN